MRITSVIWVTVVVAIIASKCQAQYLLGTPSPYQQNAKVNSLVTVSFSLQPKNLPNPPPEPSETKSDQSYMVQLNKVGVPSGADGTIKSVTLNGHTLTANGVTGDFRVMFGNSQVTIVSTKMTSLLEQIAITAQWSSFSKKQAILTGSAALTSPPVTLDVEGSTEGQCVAWIYIYNCKIDGYNAGSGTEVADSQKTEPGCYVADATVNPAVRLVVEDAHADNNTGVYRDISWSSTNKVLVNGNPPTNEQLAGSPDHTYSPIVTTANFGTDDMVSVNEKLVTLTGNALSDTIVLRPMPVPSIVVVKAIPPATLFRGPDFWGIIQNYNLEVQDKNGAPYSDGTPNEEFSNIVPAGYEPNGPGGGDTWPKGADFTDHDGYTYSNPPSPTPQTDAMAWHDSFDQTWHDIRVENPDDNHDFILNTQHVDMTYVAVTRTGPGT